VQKMLSAMIVRIRDQRHGHAERKRGTGHRWWRAWRNGSGPSH
jgi:hypothetical protein